LSLLLFKEKARMRLRGNHNLSECSETLRIPEKLVIPTKVGIQDQGLLISPQGVVLLTLG
jgi:hypothetical protein